MRRTPLVQSAHKKTIIVFAAAFLVLSGVACGYLRRTPEPEGYQNWLNYLNAHPTDFRTMVHGFMESFEYRLRFGPPPN